MTRMTRGEAIIPSHRLFLYEEIMLLALRKKGTIGAGFSEYAVAGAVLADLLLAHHIAVDDTRKRLVEIYKTEPFGDPIIDACLERIKVSKRRASLTTWVSRLARIKGLRDKVAQHLCKRGILRADEDKVLFIFTRKIYPEINPMPEKEIVKRLHTAIFGDAPQIDPRTVVLISLAHGADLLSENFDRKEIRACKKRIEQIVNGEMTGKATREVIAACQAAVLVAVIMPAIIAGTSH